MLTPESAQSLLNHKVALAREGTQLLPSLELELRRSEAHPPEAVKGLLLEVLRGPESRGLHLDSRIGCLGRDELEWNLAHGPTKWLQAGRDGDLPCRLC